MVIEEDSEGGDSERVVDLSRRPPPYEGDPNFLQKLKEDLGIQVSVSLHFLSNWNKFIFELDKDSCCAARDGQALLVPTKYLFFSYCEISDILTGPTHFLPVMT